MVPVPFPQLPWAPSYVPGTPGTCAQNALFGVRALFRQSSPPRPPLGLKLGGNLAPAWRRKSLLVSAQAVAWAPSSVPLTLAPRKVHSAVFRFLAPLTHFRALGPARGTPHALQGPRAISGHLSRTSGLSGHLEGPLTQFRAGGVREASGRRPEGARELSGRCPAGVWEEISRPPGGESPS